MRLIRVGGVEAGRVSVFNSPERDTPSWLWRPTTASSSSFYEDRYPKACECLRQDRDVMFTFYDFPGGALGPPAHDQPDSNRPSPRCAIARARPRAGH